MPVALWIFEISRLYVAFQVSFWDIIRRVKVTALRHQKRKIARLLLSGHYVDALQIAAESQETEFYFWLKKWLSN
jgi:hypothetical protein